MNFEWLDPMVRAETIALFRKLAADGLHLIIFQPHFA